MVHVEWNTQCCSCTVDTECGPFYSGYTVLLVYSGIVYSWFTVCLCTVEAQCFSCRVDIHCGSCAVDTQRGSCTVGTQCGPCRRDTHCG